MKRLLPSSRIEFISWMVVAWGLLFTYGPLFRADFAYCDDYVLMFTDDPYEEAYLSDGRPLVALAQTLVHRPIQFMGQLAYLRFAIVIGLIGIAIVFFRLARHLGGTPIERAAFAIALGTLPCLHDYVGQANIWLAPFAGLCSCIACVLTDRQLGSTDRMLGERPLSIVFPLLWMLVCGLTYQPMLSFYWTVALLMALDPRFLISTAYRRRIAKIVLIGFVYFVACFIVFKLSILLSGIPPKSRSELANNPLEKLYWFMRIQLPLALNYWQLMISGSRWLPLLTAGLTGLVIVGGFIISSRRFVNGLSNSASVAQRRQIVWLRAAIVIALVFLSHVHWLAIRELPQSYRIIAPLGVTAWVLMYWAWLQFASLIPSLEGRKTVRQNALLAVTAVATFTCQHYSEDYWVTPHSLAYRYALYCLREGITSETKHVHLVRQGRDDGLVSSYFVECFGRPSMEATWIPIDFVKLALRDCGIDHQVEKITQDETGSIATNTRTLVIDMRKMVNFRVND